MTVLNRTALEQLERDTSPEIVPVILSRFLEELQKRCDAIEAALAATAIEPTGLEAHSIKSAARTFGLEDLSSAALCLEEACEAQDGDRVPTLAAELLVSAAAARNAVEAYLAG